MIVNEAEFDSLTKSLPPAWVRVALYAAFLGMSASVIEEMIRQIRAQGATPKQAINALRVGAEAVLEGRGTQQAAVPVTNRPDVGLWS